MHPPLPGLGGRMVTGPRLPSITALSVTVPVAERLIRATFTGALSPPRSLY